MKYFMLKLSDLLLRMYSCPVRKGVEARSFSEEGEGEGRGIPVVTLWGGVGVRWGKSCARARRTCLLLPCHLLFSVTNSRENLSRLARAFDAAN